MFSLKNYAFNWANLQVANTLAFNRQLLSVPRMALGDREDFLTNQIEDWELLKASKQESDVNLFEVWEDG